MTKKQNILRRIFLIIIIVITVIGVGLNLLKYILYPDFYPNITKLGRIPGLNSGFIPQGITVAEDMDCFFAVGPTVKNEKSLLYKIDFSTGKAQEFFMTSNGQIFNGHTGGLQYTHGKLYLADEGTGVYCFSAAQTQNQANKKDASVEIGSPVKLNNHSSYIYSDDEFIYIGEFNNDTSYVCENEFSYNGTNHRAIVAKYKAGDFTKPVEVYSVPNLIQGFAVTESGTIILSTSWGLNPSNFKIYRGKDIVKTDRLMFDAPVYYLDEPTETLKGPPMSEDLDLFEGHPFTYTESASNKYIFGKLFFANYIYSLKNIN